MMNPTDPSTTYFLQSAVYVKCKSQVIRSDLFYSTVKTKQWFVNQKLLVREINKILLPESKRSKFNCHHRKGTH